MAKDYPQVIIPKTQLKNVKMKKLPVGIQSFKKIRTEETTSTMLTRPLL